MTGFDPDGRILEWGKNDMNRIKRLEEGIRLLQSKISNVKGRRQLRMVMAKRKLHQRIKNLIHDCHCKLAHALCKEYRLILLPEFETQRMVQKKKRCIGKSIARSMLTWSHYEFRERIKRKALEMGSEVIIVCERYTTKTCSRCGIKNDIGADKTYRCDECDLVMDRDENAAKNIFLKWCCCELLRKRCRLEPSSS